MSSLFRVRQNDDWKLVSIDILSKRTEQKMKWRIKASHGMDLRGYQCGSMILSFLWSSCGHLKANWIWLSNLTYLERQSESRTWLPRLARQTCCHTDVLPGWHLNKEWFCWQKQIMFTSSQRMTSFPLWRHNRWPHSLYDVTTDDLIPLMTSLMTSFPFWLQLWSSSHHQHVGGFGRIYKVAKWP